MKKCLIILTGILISSITLKASIKLIKIPIRGTNVVFNAPNFVQELNTYIISYDIPIEEIEDILIAYINQKPENVSDEIYYPKEVLQRVSRFSQSDKIVLFLDSIIKSNKSNFYYRSINAFLYTSPFSLDNLVKIEEYIKLNDETSYIRRSEFYNKFSYAIDRNETLSVDVKFEMIKLMLKYLSSDLYNWRFLDQELCEKIPSYRYSIQRKNMIEYVQSNETSLNEWQKGELTKILDAFNSAIKEKSLINLTDEIITEEINAYVPVPPKQGIGIWEP
jgi:hypothetical protein